MAAQYSQVWQATKKTVLERNCYMFNNPLISDITFTCGESEERFYAHRYVLASSSPIFYEMFYGDFAERSSVINLYETSAECFEEFLRFLYTDECKLTPEIAIKVMYLAKKFIVPSLTEKCVEILYSSIKPDNVLTVLEEAIHFDEVDLADKCWQVVDLQTPKVVTSEGFPHISQKMLTSLLKRSTLNIKEVALFQALINWSDHQCFKCSLEATGENRRAVVGDAIYKISFISMTQEEFAVHVPLSGLLTAEEMIPIYGRLNGIGFPALKWKIPNRKANKVRFARFSVANVQNSTNPDCMWRNTGLPDRLSFSVNRSGIKFHGVRLFGNDNGSPYNVFLEINGAKTNGTYVAKRDSKGVCGFDVLVPAPIVIDKNKIVTMSARIEGPVSQYGTNGKPSVEIDGVTVTFSEVSGLGTNVRGGQFYQIILSI